jgi:hypothetical protein
MTTPGITQVTEAQALPLAGFYTVFLEHVLCTVRRGIRGKEEANETGEFLAFWISSTRTHPAVQASSKHSLK